MLDCIMTRSGCDKVKKKDVVSGDRNVVVEIYKRAGK